MRKQKGAGPGGPAVLIVDDDALVAAALARMLAGRFRRCLAGGALDALDQLASSPFAVIITDYQMPTHDGLWLLEQVSRRYPETLRVLCSGSPPRDLAEHLASARVQLFLPKPVCAAVLHEALDAIS